eukprot:5680874-Pyramimonas_sp.AAC.1
MFFTYASHPRVPHMFRGVLVFFPDAARPRLLSRTSLFPSSSHHCLAQLSSAQLSAAQLSTVQFSSTQHSRARHGTAQHSKSHSSTVQHSTA